MFYQPGLTEHGLPHDPFKACVVPRPIGWISTVSVDGKSHNLAPYSQFNNLSFDPPCVMFSANQTHEGKQKDTAINAEQTGKFCWNLTTYSLRHAVNKSAEQVSYGVDEFEQAGLSKCYSTVVKVRDQKGCPSIAVPMVQESPVRFECEYHSTVRLPGNPPMGTVDVIIGKVVGIHIDDSVLTDGKIDVRKTNPIARMGYYEYAAISEAFEMIPPGDVKLLAGLEGSSKRNQALLSPSLPVLAIL